MAKKFHFHESLEEMSLPEMFASIHRHKVPGLMEISQEEITKRIFIHDGTVVHAASNDRSDRLGAHLYRLGKLDREQLVETMRLKEESGKRHGQLLIEEGILSPGDLLEAVQSQIRAIVWSVFAWQTGEVRFDIGDFSEPLMIKIHLPVRQVIVQGIKKVPDTRGLVQRLGKKSSLFRPAYCTEDLIELALDRDEYALLRLVDGERSLYDICTLGPYSASENARLLYAFRVLRLIERIQDDPTSTGLKLHLGPDSNIKN